MQLLKSKPQLAPDISKQFSRKIARAPCHRPPNRQGDERASPRTRTGHRLSSKRMGIRESTPKWVSTNPGPHHAPWKPHKYSSAP